VIDPTPVPVIEQLAKVDSTNAELIRRCGAGKRGAMAIYALVQTAGRGRNGKTWEAPQSGLFFSQTLHFQSAPCTLAGLSLALGVAAVEALQEAISPHAALEILLKWPNDLWISQQKLAGILLEIAPNLAGQNSGQTTVVAGIGVNLAGAAGDDRTDLAAHGVSLDAATLAPIMLAHWQCAARRFELAGFANFHTRWAALDALAGQDVTLSDHPGVIWRAEGVGVEGALALRSGEGIERRIGSGEVSLSTRLAGRPRGHH